MVALALRRLHRFLWRLEGAVLVLILTATIGFAVAQVLLRNLFHSGLAWGDPLVRILVLWLGMVGAMIASRRHEHIHIDVFTRRLPERLQNGVHRLTDLFTAAVCLIVAWHALMLIRIEFADGYPAFASVPAWLAEAVIPFGFAVMGLRYLLSALRGRLPAETE